MADKMLIDASHEEETRVVVVRGNRIEEFDFESQHKKQIRGNIYLAKVTRVEPSLQAAFVDYGGNRHGFLAFAEIHPDYYQIPLADRQALMQQEAEDQRKIAEAEAADPVVDLAHQEQPDIGISIPAPTAEPASEAGAEAAEAGPVEAVAGEETEKPKAKPRRSRARKKPAEEAAALEAGASEGEGVPSSENNDDDGSTPGEMAAMVETDSISEDVDARRGGRNDDFDDDDDDDHGEKEVIESVGAEDAMEEVPERVVRKPRKQYRIQEVIKRRQILLVQVAKEERGNKGAALTTYLSLAGRYSVLMPNTARGGGISRKITQPQDRKRLKEIARELDVPQGMGVILRTAGANRTRVEVKRDFEYLMRLWENVRTLTLSSTAPTLVYEEGSLIKRSIRDLYNKDISEIIVSGEEGYREAKDFMKMLMPSHAKVVQPYRDLHPIFARSGIEAQLDRMLQPQVTLKSGGYLIMNQTEALVAIDVNSGRSTREHSIEETALQTNLEAAEEVARQLRLRDLAGLIVIDFIDMEEKRNNRAVEKKLKDCLKNDRARIQVGRISHFGLLEMSRQRIRASVLESTTQICTHCGGTGHVRSQSSVALHVLRGVEEYLLKNTTHDITVRTTPEIALYLLNHKRASIVDYENRFGVSIFIESDVSIGSSHFAIDRGEPVENPVKIESLMQFAAIPVEEDDDDIVIEADEEEEEEEETVAAAAQPAVANAERAQQQGDDPNGRKRKRRRRRRNRGGEKGGDAQTAQGGNDDMADGDEDGDEGEDDVSEAGEASDATVAADSDSEENRRKRRRRGKRGGRRNRNGEDGQELSASDDGDAADEDASSEDVAAVPAAAVAEASEEAAVEAVPAPAEAEAAPGGKPEAKPRRSRRGKAATAADIPAAEEAAVVVPAPVETVVEQVEAALGQEPQAPEATPAEEAPVAEAEQADSGEAKPARANRASNISSSVEAVVKSSDPVAAPETEGDPSKPKKAGWWQRRGFF
ncbi:Rne/Rng family ribonuclease [Neorhizobium galegae]|uniref:Rne/Rng family ribonuclease n=1 Tax=Neorhizobium galegae TaxID=399 RepID=UPI0006216557|nr:ribonuclease E/G [Neorhizobium galegae]KAB1126150.1 ribonuclease E/G [Neorhizobium galegae]MCQ1805118.1 ribonuclease E/G [Neorhizobium galegae]CDZ55879.1 Ribonuclease, Rne/Rng family [Neorhizobium galegae bv. orientalis]